MLKKNPLWNKHTWGKAWRKRTFVLFHIFSLGQWCSHASIPAVGSGRVWPRLQPVHSGPAVGAMPCHPNGVQAGDGCSAVLLGHRLWQQHLPESPRFWSACPLPRGNLWEPSEFLSFIGVSEARVRFSRLWASLFLKRGQKLTVAFLFCQSQKPLQQFYTSHFVYFFFFFFYFHISFTTENS